MLHRRYPACSRVRRDGLQRRADAPPLLRSSALFDLERDVQHGCLLLARSPAERRVPRDSTDPDAAARQSCHDAGRARCPPRQSRARRRLSTHCKAIRVQRPRPRCRRPAPSRPTAPALLVSKPTTSPVPARAGQRVTARVKVARSDTGDSPATLTVRCPARLGIRAANASVRSFANGRATCSWRTPRSARGLSLSASVLVSYRGVSARRGVTVLLH